MVSSLVQEGLWILPKEILGPGFDCVGKRVGVMDASALVMPTLHPWPHRQKILKERAVPMIEGYMFEEHEMIRRAATECMCNLAMSTEVRVGPGGGHGRQARRSTCP